MAQNHNPQDEVYRFIKAYLKARHGLSPSIREIAAGCHMHPSTAARYVDVLAAEGKIEREPGKVRTIRLAARKPKTNVSKPRQTS